MLPSDQRRLWSSWLAGKTTFFAFLLLVFIRAARARGDDAATAGGAGHERENNFFFRKTLEFAFDGWQGVRVDNDSFALKLAETRNVSMMTKLKLVGTQRALQRLSSVPSRLTSCCRPDIPSSLALPITCPPFPTPAMPRINSIHRPYLLRRHHPRRQAANLHLANL